MSEVTKHLLLQTLHSDLGGLLTVTVIQEHRLELPKETMRPPLKYKPLSLR